MHKETYDRLYGEREGFLYQARQQSELTIPSLIPPDGKTANYRELYKPFQSIGAYGVNALANKLSSALYPTNEPWFKFSPNMSQEEFDNTNQESLDVIESELAAQERNILDEINKRGDRGVITEALKHLIVAGNVVIYIGDERSRMYSLDEYVCMRDGEGSLLKLITKDVLSYETYKESFPDHTAVHAAHRGARAYDPKHIEVYTCMYRKDNMWYVEEEVAGIIISSSTSKHKIDQPPYLCLRFSRIDGQSYGRAYVENLYGDLRSLEELSKSMVEASAINARTVFLINPTGATSARRFEEAQNGDVIPGISSDITTARVDKSADLAVTANQIDRLESRLNQAFMLTAAQQRDAERVTATEIRAVAQEVETILGGAYSILSEDFQRPFITRLVDVLQKSDKIPTWDTDLLDISIVTGTAGIGRGVDRQRMVEFFSTLAETVGPATIEQYVNVPVALARLAASFGIKLEGLVKSPQQIQQEQQQAQQAQLASTLGPQAISSAGQIATEQMKVNQNGSIPETQNNQNQ